MSEARTHILATIRTALGRGALAGPQAADLEARLHSSRVHVVPARAQGTPDELIARFIEEAARADASIQRLPNKEAVPAALAAYLKESNLPARFKAAPDPELQDIPFADEPTLEVQFGSATPDDEVALMAALAGVAETGTLVMASQPVSPTLLNFLPETQIVILPARRIVGAYEEAWRLLREKVGTHSILPRAINFITGPSRTADIEQTLLLGAHGPKRLHIFVIDAWK